MERFIKGLNVLLDPATAAASFVANKKGEGSPVRYSMLRSAAKL